ncbi:sensor histidine kinase, partial [Turicibacter sanguinis]|nr:sensor histidine kinase [Turicibacter sanguinis]
MKKFKLTLKWRFTLLTLVIMILTSAILVVSINYDIKKTMPGLTDLIIDI